MSAMHSMRYWMVGVVGIVFIGSMDGRGVPSAHARFATQSDAESEVLFQHWNIEVAADGSYTSTLEMKVKILMEGGKKNWVTQPLVYEQDLQEIKILEASTFSEGQTYPVSAKNIEDKPVASGFEGFTNYRQVLLSFPHSQVGSELYLKYKLTQKEAYIDHVFSMHLQYGGDAWVKTADLHFSSHLPLQIKIHDPENYFEVTPQADALPQNPQIFELHLKRPIMRRIVDETQNHLSPERFPSLKITSLPSWGDLSTRIAPPYEKVLAEPLPPLFVQIATQAAQKKTLIEKINAVTSQLAVELNYRGDWTSVSGKFYPRSLKSIVDQRRSDCKDFASSTVAILRHLGIQAHVALVRRGGIYEDTDQVPHLSAFNHAIVRVLDSAPAPTGKKILWIDPTNFSSFAQGMFPDIAGRHALPLIAGSDREWIPAIAPEDNQIQVSTELSFQEHERAWVQGSLIQKGSAAIHATGALLRTSKETIDYSIVSFAAGNIDRVLQYTVEPYALKTRTVKDHPFHYRFLIKDAALKSNLGPAFSIKPSSLVGQLLIQPEGRESDLYLSEAPMQVQLHTHLKAVRVTRLTPPCHVHSPWLDATRRSWAQNKGVTIEDVYTLKTGLIPNAVLHSPAFLGFQNELEACLNNRVLVFRK